MSEAKQFSPEGGMSHGSEPGHKWSWTLLVALLFLAAGATGCGGKSGNAAGQQQGPPGVPVKVQAAKSVAVNDTTEYVATLKSRNSAVIMPQVEGYISRIYVRSGEKVSSGAPVMQIDPEKQQATVTSQQSSRTAQEANLKWAQQQYERASGLANAGVMSKQELDQAKANLDAAKAQLGALDASVREQQVQLRYYKVTAPWSGTVGDIPVHVGDRVATNTLLTTVDKPGDLEVYIYVPVERSSLLRMNLPVQVVDGAGKVIAESRISFVSPQVDPTTQTLLVKARVAEGHALRQSQFIRARVIWGTQEHPMIPVVAVSRIGGQYFAFIAEKGQNGAYVARQKPLRLGQIAGNDYVVLDGVRPGDQIVVSGTQFLIDGAPVLPQEASS